MNDLLAQLAEANPVQADDLMPLDLPARFARRMPHRRLGLAAAVATIAAGALAGVYALNGSDAGLHHNRLGQLPGLEGPINTGGGIVGATGSTGPTGTTGPPDSAGPTGTQGTGEPKDPASRQGPGISVQFDRSGGTLTSLNVSAWEFEKTGFQLKVVYYGPPGNWHSPYAVVYRTTVSPADMSSTTGSVGVGPSGRSGPGPVAWTWDGTLDSSNWRGGCKSGDYDVEVEFRDASGAFVAGVSSNEFLCAGN